MNDPSRGETVWGLDARQLAVAAASIYAVYFGFLTTWRLLSFQLHPDWGTIANATYYTSQGYFFRSAFRGLASYTFWQQHFSPILLVFVPIFRVDGLAGSVAMVTSQAVANGAAGYLLFLLARHWFGSGRVGLLAALFFYANGRIQMAVLHDFHKLTLTPVFLFLAFLGAETGRRGRMWLGFVGTLILREDTFLALVGLPLFLLVVRRRWRLGTLMLALIVGYELLLFTLVFPALGGQYRYFGYYAWLAPTPRELMVLAVTRPLWLVTRVLTKPNIGDVVAFLNEFFWLPLLSPAGWLTGLFAMSQSLLTTKGAVAGYRHHYGVPPAAMLTLGTLLTLRLWTPLARRRAIDLAGAILALLVVFGLGRAVAMGAMPYSQYVRRPQLWVTEENLRKMREARELFARIPRGEMVQMSFNLFSRYHSNLGVFPYGPRRELRPATRFLLLMPQDNPPAYSVSFKTFHAFLHDPAWTLIGRGDHVFLFERNGGVPVRLEEALVTELRPAEVSSQSGAPDFLRRRLTAPRGKEGYLAYGPRLEVPAGSYRAEFRLETDVSAGEVCRIDIATNRGRVIRASRTLLAEDFSGGKGRFVLGTALDQPVDDLEARVYGFGRGTVTFSGGRISWLPARRRRCGASRGRGGRP